MNVAAYIRVSTREQKEKGFSIPEQKERIGAYCKAKGWNLCKVYEDGGYTGANLDRPAMQKLMRDCEIYDLVLVWKLDRLSRSQKDTLSLIDHFKERGTAFASMQENFDTSTAFGMAMVGILSVFAQLEREQIKERTAIGREGRAKSGKWHGGGHAPTGYSYDKTTGALVPNDEADQVRLIYKLFLDGMGYADITQYMHDRYTTRYTSYNNVSTVVRMLRNPVYVGMVKHNSEYIPDCHEAIVDQGTFDAVQAVLRSRRNGNKNAAGRHLLTGMVFCECGKHMMLNTVGKYKYYICCRKYSGNLSEKEKPCGNRRIREADLNQAVMESVLKLKFKPLKVKKREKPTDTGAEIAKIDKQISKLIDLYAIDSIPMDELKKRIAELEEKKRLLTGPEAPVMDLKPYTSIQSKAKEIFDTDDISKSRAVIDTLVRNVTVTKDSVKIKWEFA